MVNWNLTPTLPALRIAHPKVYRYPSLSKVQSLSSIALEWSETSTRLYNAAHALDLDFTWTRHSHSSRGHADDQCTSLQGLKNIVFEASHGANVPHCARTETGTNTGSWMHRINSLRRNSISGRSCRSTLSRDLPLRTSTRSCRSGSKVFLNSVAEWDA